MSGICNSFFFGFSVVTNEEDMSAVSISNVVVNIGEITMSWYFINTHSSVFFLHFGVFVMYCVMHTCV